jgi:type VI secretion system protein ImpB
MAKESIQDKLSRVRKPRVHITYQVQVGDAIEEKHLPFVVGVLADLSGQPKEPLPRLKERKFVEIDRDNFNQVLAGVRPRLAYRVPNRLADDGTQLGVELEFQHMDDFGPEAVANQVEPVRKLVEARRQLREVALKLTTNEKLEDLLNKVVTDTAALKQLAESGGSPTPEGNPKPSRGGQNNG